MKQKSGLIGVVYAAILSAIAGYFFRATQLSGSSSVPLIAFSILMVFVFALAAASLEKKSAYEDIYRPCGQDLVFSLLGALGLLAGCALGFRGSIAQMLVSLLGLLAGTQSEGKITHHQLCPLPFPMVTRSDWYTPDGRENVS